MDPDNSVAASELAENDDFSQHSEDENEAAVDEAGAEALPDLKNFEDASQISQHSTSPTSNSGGHFALPMGASACSMARSGNSVPQFPTNVPVRSHQSSPVLYDNAVSAVGASASVMSQDSGSKPISGKSFFHSAQSLPNSVAQSPARAASVDEASAELANLLEIEGSNSGSTSSNNRRVYQHALSVRVPSNNSNNPQQGMSNNGAVPRRNHRRTGQNNNSSNSGNVQEE